MSESASTVQNLLPALRRGDAEACRLLVRRMGEPLLRYALVIVTDPGTAEDVVQKAFLRIYSTRKQLDEHAELRGLCYRIVRNLARNALRDRSLRWRREREATMQADGSTDAGHSELAHEAWECAKALPAELREVIELRFAGGLSRAEMASALELPEGTVATRQRTALQRLREQLAGAGTFSAAITMPQLSQALEQASPSIPFPEMMTQMEELVMADIRTMKLKVAFTAVTVAVLALLLLGGGTVAIAGWVAPTRDAGTRSEVSTLAARPETPRARSGRGESTPAVNAPSSGDLQTDTGGLNSAAAQFAEDPIQPAPAPSPAAPDTPEGAPEVGPEVSDPAPMVKTVAPRFLSDAVRKAAVGTMYVYRIRTSGTPSPALEADELPAWLALDGETLRGTPARGDAGLSKPILLVAANGTQPDARQPFQVFVFAAPVITSTAPTKAEVGKEYLYKISVTGTPAPTLTVTGNPKWLTLKGGVLSGTPGNNEGGRAGPISLVAVNGADPDALQEFTVEAMSPPRIVSKPVTVVKAGALYTYAVKTTGFPAPKLSAKGLPKWLKLKGAVLSGTPKLADIGKSKKIRLTAKNGIKSNAKQSFMIIVGKAAQDYIEIPWTVEDMKKYIRVGLSWHRFEISGMDGPWVTGYGRTTEIVATDKKGFTVRYTNDKNGQVTPGGITNRVFSWDRALEFVRLDMKVQLKNPILKVSNGTLKIAGKTYKCIVHEYKATDKLNKGVTQAYYFVLSKPFTYAIHKITFPWMDGQLIGSRTHTLDKIVEP